MNSRISFLLFCLLLTSLILNSARAQTTNPDSGPLKIHVTAVQGGAQFRPDSSAKWQPVTANLDAAEGVEFRTGPKGTIQFTVGSDQIYRVDRLTVVKVLRANLNADGTIRTDVGMTYGRVSKDVDLPQHPHQDTIISPSSTLAVRGTQVGVYDQAPFAPQATSLTGTAVYHNAAGQQFSFGSKGGGTNTVSGNAVGAAQFQLNNTLVAPTGNFAGLTGPELQNVQNNPGGPPPGPAGQVAQHNNQIVGGMDNSSTVQTLLPVGFLSFDLTWQSNVPFSVVDLTVKDPGGVTVSSANNPPGINSPNGPFYFGSRVGNLNINGQSGTSNGGETFAYGAATGGTFSNGNYIVTAILQGAGSQTLSQIPILKINAVVSASEVTGSGLGPVVVRRLEMPQASTSIAVSTPFFLQLGNSTATFTVPVPVVNGSTLSPSGFGSRPK